MKVELLLCLAFSCPFDQSMDSCVFNGLRKKDMKERIEQITALDKKSAERLYSVHKSCLALREKDQITLHKF